MKKKINKTEITDFKKFLNKSMTTKQELEDVMKKLNIPGNVAWLIDFDKKQPNQILNMGNGFLGGTHWIAVDNINKRYFDSFGLPPPPTIPKDYEYTTLHIQNINYGRCGQYCILFLYYSNMDEVDKFINKFEINY